MADHDWLVCIDPSVNSLGYAVFDMKTGKLLKYGQVESTTEEKRLPLEMRIQKQMAQLMALLPGSECRMTWIIEEPELFGGTVSTAAVHNASLKKLIMIVGAIVWQGWLVKANVVLIPVTMWKGQLPKFVTRERSEQKHDIKFKSSQYDAADAVSLGDWYLEKGKVFYDRRQGSSVSGA